MPSPEGTPSEKPRYAVPALIRGATILNILAHRDSGTLSDLAREAKVAKTTALQILDTMVQIGWVERAAMGHYRLGVGLYLLGMAASQHRSLREVATPVMQQLVAATGLTAHLAVYQDGAGMVVEKIEGPGFIKFGTHIGQRIPLHHTAMGRVLAAHLEESELDRALHERGMIRNTARTITDPAQFKALLPQVRLLGYALEDEEDEPGVRCVGAPVRDLSGQVVAALSVTAVVPDLPYERIPEIAKQVTRSAEQISRQMGVGG